MYKETLVDSDYTHVVRYDIHNVTFKVDFDQKDEYIMSDFAPYVFDDIRRLLGVSREDYKKSVGPEGILGSLLLGYLNSMRELGAQGGSGALFYLTPDGNYFVKTIKKVEFDIAIKTLKQYHEHLKRNINSLIYKVTGLYTIKTFVGGKQRILYIVITKNIFSDLKVDKVYDLKGSTHGRTCRRGKGGSVMKDLDWIQDRRKFKLDKGLQSYISQVIESDSLFLSSLKVMDYSLLLGIHEIKGDPETYLNHLTREADKTDKFPNGMKKPIHNIFRGGVVSHDKTCIYLFAIIDIYTLYNGTKKVENFFKTVAYGKGVSSVDPKIYAARFKSFLNKQFG